MDRGTSVSATVSRPPLSPPPSSPNPRIEAPLPGGGANGVFSRSQDRSQDHFSPRSVFSRSQDKSQERYQGPETAAPRLHRPAVAGPDGTTQQDSAVAVESLDPSTPGATEQDWDWDLVHGLGSDSASVVISWPSVPASASGSPPHRNVVAAARAGEGASSATTSSLVLSPRSPDGHRRYHAEEAGVLPDSPSWTKTQPPAIEVVLDPIAACLAAEDVLEAWEALQGIVAQLAISGEWLTVTYTA